MLDIAWPELLVIGAVALVVIGPKDLPKVMRAAGQWAGKARRTMHDIQRHFDQLNYETEVAERLQRQAKQDTSAPRPPDQLPPAIPSASEPKTGDHDRT